MGKKREFAGLTADVKYCEKCNDERNPAQSHCHYCGSELISTKSIAAYVDCFHL